MIVLVAEIQTWAVKSNQTTIRIIAVLQMGLYLGTLLTHGYTLRAFLRTLKVSEDEEIEAARLAEVARLTEAARAAKENIVTAKATVAEIKSK